MPCISRFSSAFIVALLLALVPAARAQLGPDDELKALRYPDSFEVSVFAAEPMITNPAAIDVDTQGRVWVAEIQWYRRAAKDPPADKIKVLEDTDGDGRADKVTTFADHVFAPMSICVAGNKVYVATSPDLWVYEDKNGDLVADGPPTKLLTGFGGQNHDHSAHSLVLGPDHKWWMAHGDRGFKVTGTDGSKIEYQWGAMLRGELDGSQLETVAVNFRNPYEVCVSSFGEPFCSDNDNDGNFSVRVCWIMEGGDYGWFGRPPGVRGCVPASIPLSEHWHFRGHIPGYVPALLVTGFGSPCGMCFYEGDAFGPSYKDAPWHADNGPREVRLYRTEPAGAGFRAKSQNLITSEGDNYFRPDDVCTAPDGSVYVSDWYDGGVGGHAYNNPEQGRVFRVRPKGRQLQRVGKPGPYASVDDALLGLQSPNLATQFLARERLLADGEKSVAAIAPLLRSAEPNVRARALWLLDRIGGAGRQMVVDQLSEVEPRWRALAVRILRRHGNAYAGSILAMAGESDPEVRREVLLALPKLQGPDADAALVTLATGYDGYDRYMLEAIQIAAAGRKPMLYEALKKQKAFTTQNVQLLQLLDPRAATETLMGFLKVATNDNDRLEALQDLAIVDSVEAFRGMLSALGKKEASPEVRRRALELLTGNLGALWKAYADDPALAATLGPLLKEPDWQQDVLALIAGNGMGQFGGDVLKLASDAKTQPAVRTQAFAVAAQLRVAGAAQALEAALSDGNPDVRTAAVGALVDLQDWAALKRLLVDSGTGDEVRGQVVARMMSSTGGALALLRWLDEKVLADPLRAKAIELAAKHPDTNVRVLYERFVPEDQRPQRLGAAIDAKTILALQGDASRGEQIFFQSTAAQCKNCHQVKGFGGTIGPDLTQIGKKYERAALLETILDPSKAIGPEFIVHLAETDDGLVYAGFVVEKSERQVVLKDSQGKMVRLKLKDVVTLEPQKKSMMPELVLRDVTAQDAADLLAYLETLTAPWVKK